MAYTEDKNQDELDAASVPLDGTELLPVFQDGETKQCTVNDVKDMISAWKTSGNAGTDDSTDFIGTSDNQDVVFKSNNNEIFRISENQMSVQEAISDAFFAVFNDTEFIMDNAHTSNFVISEEAGSDILIVNANDNRITIDPDNVGYNMGIGVVTPDSSAILELKSTTRGLLLPRMTKSQRNSISSPVAGLVIFQTDNTPGLRVYNGTHWVRYTETNDD